MQVWKLGAFYRRSEAGALPWGILEEPLNPKC